MSKKAIVIIMSVIFFESCAIHKKFPFVCFLGPCIERQWHFRENKASIKRKSAMIVSQQKRRKYQRSKAEKMNALNDGNSENQLTLFKPNKVDSVLNFKKNITQFDTLIIINYLVAEDSINSSEKLVLENYFFNHKDKKFELRLQEYSNRIEKYRYSKRIKGLIKFLNDLSISVSVIHVKKQQKITNGANERIEIRLR